MHMLQLIIHQVYCLFDVLCTRFLKWNDEVANFACFSVLLSSTSLNNQGIINIYDEKFASFVGYYFFCSNHFDFSGSQNSFLF